MAPPRTDRQISRARSLAYDILMRVEGGAWASELLAALPQDLDRRDAGLASEIVYGTLRRQAQLDFRILRGARRAAAELDPAVRVALRLGLYQVHHLDRVPAHAAVDESVELVKRAGSARAAGLVNAVLRHSKDTPVEYPDRATALSMPEWLLRRWERQFGGAAAEAIALEFLSPPQIWIRNPPADAVLTLEPSAVPGAWRVVSGDSRGLRIQDIGSQSIVPLLDLAPGQTFLDVCAAPGNKTAQALESGVRAIACDRYLHRLRNVTGCSRVVLDAAEGLPFRGRFDRILVDAPCSGTGTLGRHPEIRWRLQPEDLLNLHGRQVRILRNSLDLLDYGGILVYSTCSLERRENEDVVERVLRKKGGAFRLERELRRIPGVDPGDGFYAAVIRSVQAR